MRVNDSDVKKMVERVGTIHTKVAVIETKVIAIDKHLEVQNDRLNKHATAIRGLQVEQEGLKVKMWFMVAGVGAISGIIGGVLGKILAGVI